MSKRLFAPGIRHYFSDAAANDPDGTEHTRELVATLPPGNNYITIQDQDGLRVYRLLQAELDPGELDPANIQFRDSLS